MVALRRASLITGLLLASFVLDSNSSMAEDHEVAVDQVDVVLPAVVAQEFFVGGATTVKTGNKRLKGRKFVTTEDGVKGGVMDAYPAQRKILKPTLGRKLIDADVLPKRVNISKGLVAFNSDYYVPRPHPPKNN